MANVQEKLGTFCHFDPLIKNISLKKRTFVPK